jgi:2-C-methyl-D-erythritol 2,4-cyclodiphosphate synthase
MIARTGIGYDVHRFAHGRRLILGGVEIPHECGLEGHSDADVLSHAIADALLGAAGLPDIGHHFPTGDPSIKGISSLKILAHVANLLKEADVSVHNVDATLIAEAPRIAPHLGEMKAAISEALGLGPETVGIKATTNEGMGFLGRGEGIAALASACVSSSSGGSRNSERL